MRDLLRDESHRDRGSDFEGLFGSVKNEFSLIAPLIVFFVEEVDLLLGEESGVQDNSHFPEQGHVSHDHRIDTYQRRTRQHAPLRVACVP